MLTSYMELKDLRSVQVESFGGTVHRVVIGNPVLTAGSLAANYASDKYMQSKGINSQTQFDSLAFEDMDGKKHVYGVQHQDIQQFMNVLSQVAPHIRILS